MLSKYMKKYFLILLFLSTLLILAGDHFRPPTVKTDESNSPSPSENHDHSEHPDVDHSDPENNRRMGIFHFNEGNKFFRQEKWEEAVRNYEMALHHNEDFQETYVNLSTTYIRTGKFDEALKALQSLEKINGSNPLLHYNLACLYSLTGQGQTSLVAIKKAVDLGYQGFQQIQTDADLENLRKEPEFDTWFQAIQHDPQG